MKKITINKIGEDIYYQKLENGMDIYFYVNKYLHNNVVTFTTRYGSIYNEILDKNGKYKRVPNGIAHFLEHKVFVQKEGPQPEEFYGMSGCLSNAYTTFKNTTYLFTGFKNIYENVNYLLDFVQNIYLTDENVESEKGIITQEINMCNDRPSDILYDKIRENAIKVNPFKESIIGTVKSVNSITKEELLECYNNFYHPGNMFLVVTGNYDIDKMLETIKNNQNKKTFKKKGKCKLREYVEPDMVVKEREIIKCNTNIPKVAYSLKIPIKNFNIDKRKLSVYMFIIFNLLFGDTSKFDEEAKKKEIITNTIYYNILNIDTHFIVSLINTCEKYEELIKMIDEYLKNINFDEKELERKKKVLISNEVFSYENVEMVNDMIVDNIIFDNRIEEDMISMIEDINMEELNEIVEKIDFNNKSIVILKK